MCVCVGEGGGGGYVRGMKQSSCQFKSDMTTEYMGITWHVFDYRQAFSNLVGRGDSSGEHIFATIDEISSVLVAVVVSSSCIAFATFLTVISNSLR